MKASDRSFSNHPFSIINEQSSSDFYFGFLDQYRQHIPTLTPDLISEKQKQLLRVFSSTQCQYHPFKAQITQITQQSITYTIKYGFYQTTISALILNSPEIIHALSELGIKTGTNQLRMIRQQNEAPLTVRVWTKPIDTLYLEESLLKELFVSKFASALGVGPKLHDYDEYDLIVLHNKCFQFAEHLEQREVKQQKEKHTKDLLEGLAILHYFQGVHCSLSPQKIRWSPEKDKYILWNFESAELLPKPVGLKTLTSAKGCYKYASKEMKCAFIFKEEREVDLFYNDLHCVNTISSFQSKMNPQMVPEVKESSFRLLLLQSSSQSKGHLISESNIKVLYLRGQMDGIWRNRKYMGHTFDLLYPVERELEEVEMQIVRSIYNQQHQSTQAQNLPFRQVYEQVLRVFDGYFVEQANINYIYKILDLYMLADKFDEYDELMSKTINIAKDSINEVLVMTLLEKRTQTIMSSFLLQGQSNSVRQPLKKNSSQYYETFLFSKSQDFLRSFNEIHNEGSIDMVNKQLDSLKEVLSKPQAFQIHQRIKDKIQNFWQYFDKELRVKLKTVKNLMYNYEKLLKLQEEGCDYISRTEIQKYLFYCKYEWTMKMDLQNFVKKVPIVQYLCLQIQIFQLLKNHQEDDAIQSLNQIFCERSRQILGLNRILYLIHKCIFYTHSGQILKVIVNFIRTVRIKPEKFQSIFKEKIHHQLFKDIFLNLICQNCCLKLTTALWKFYQNNIWLRQLLADKYGESILEVIEFTDVLIANISQKISTENNKIVPMYKKLSEEYKQGFWVNTLIGLLPTFSPTLFNSELIEEILMVLKRKQRQSEMLFMLSHNLKAINLINSYFKERDMYQIMFKFWLTMPADLLKYTLHKDLEQIPDKQLIQFLQEELLVKLQVSQFRCKNYFLLLGVCFSLLSRKLSWEINQKIIFHISTQQSAGYLDKRSCTKEILILQLHHQQYSKRQIFLKKRLFARITTSGSHLSTLLMQKLKKIRTKDSKKYSEALKKKINMIKNNLKKEANHLLIKDKMV